MWPLLGLLAFANYSSLFNSRIFSWPWKWPKRSNIASLSHIFRGLIDL